MTFRIAVVGGSLGGLTVGCLLRDAGHDVTIYERSTRELEQRGAGIGFLPATYRYLVEHTDVDLSTISIETPFIRYLKRDGSVAHEAKHPYLFSSWNTVYRTLLDAFDSDRYQLGHELVDFDRTPTGATARFENGFEAQCDLLVAADGIGSLARSRLQPTATPGYAGYVAWRGMVPESELDETTRAALGDAITYYVYANSHVLAYPIPGIDGDVAPGQRLINFVWYRNYNEGDDLDHLLTDASGTRRELSVPPGAVAAVHEAELRATAAARLPPQLGELVAKTAQPFLQVVFDLEIDRIVFDRVALLGDAAFLVRPHAAAGTAKAADDGWTLTQAIENAETLDQALAAWEPAQLALGHDLQQRTRRIGVRSQVENSWTPGDPEFIFGLYRPGD